jgi:hypothetical protein
MPNSDPYFEIWPPAFRTYNVMVPNFVNLPFAVWGMAAPPDILGLAMYASSRATECSYCAAHTCSFALRRGATAEKVARATDDDPAGYTAAERAAVAMARAIATVPTTFTAAHRAELEASLSKGDAEWIFLGVAMMGFLNKFMDRSWRRCATSSHRRAGRRASIRTAARDRTADRRAPTAS